MWGTGDNDYFPGPAGHTTPAICLPGHLNTHWLMFSPLPNSTSKSLSANEKKSLMLSSGQKKVCNMFYFIKKETETKTKITALWYNLKLSCILLRLSCLNWKQSAQDAKRVGFYYPLSNISHN